MKITGLESNNELLKEIAYRIQRQRIDMGLTQLQLANRAGVSLRTIVNIEKGLDVKMSNLISVLRAENLAHNLDCLLPEGLIRPSDYQKLNKPKKRVRSNNKKTTTWTWGDEK